MEKNIVKETAKELGMTQKQLAEYIGVHEETVSKWSRGIVETPSWALKMFELLKTEKKYNTIKQLITGEFNK
jgi:DNA-binding transcriptional regulator YiaG